MRRSAGFIEQRFKLLGINTDMMGSGSSRLDFKGTSVDLTVGMANHRSTSFSLSEIVSITWQWIRYGMDMDKFIQNSFLMDKSISAPYSMDLKFLYPYPYLRIWIWICIINEF